MTKTEDYPMVTQTNQTQAYCNAECRQRNGSKTVRLAPLGLLIVPGLLIALAGCATPARRVTPPVVVHPPVATRKSPSPIPKPPAKPPRARQVIRTHVPVRYVVRKGDTLWGIASRYLRSPWRWPDIWYLNPAIKNPDLIYPGDLILLGYEHGERELTIERQGRIVASTSRRRLRALMAQSTARSGLSVVTLRPQMIVRPLPHAIAMIPYALIAPFLTRTDALGTRVYDHLPYILRSVRRMPYDAAHERVYVRGLPVATHRHYAVIRMFRAIRDPSTGDRLGYEVEEIGRVRVIRTADPALVELTRSSQPIQEGDRLIPISQAGIHRNIHPTVPSKIIQGQIVDVLPDSPDIGQYAIVIIDRGRMAGLKSGNVLDIFRPGESMSDPMAYGSESDHVRLLPIKVGTALVFKTYAQFSYALVMHEHWQVHVLAPVASPQINPRKVKFIKVARPWD